MKILYITAEGFDTPNPNNQMAEVMIDELLKKGHSIHLIQSHRKGVTPDIPSNLIGRANLVADTVKRKVVDKSNFVKRYFNDVKYHFDSLKHWRKVKDADVVYLQSNPTIYFPMILIKILKPKMPIVYSIYDVFPGHAYDIGVIRNKLLYNIFKIMQKPCYKMASAITVLSEDMKDIVVKEGAREKDVYVVPAWFDVNTAREIPENDNQFIKKFAINTNLFRVQYAGSLGYVFNYKTILEVAKRLKHENDIVFQIIGDGPVKQIFMDEATKMNLTNLEFYPLQPVSLVSDVYSACNVCLIPLKKGVIGNGTPSKAPILMACRRTIVNAVELWSKYAKIFEDYNMGIAKDVYDYDGLAQSIIYLKDNPKVLNKMANNAYEYGNQKFSSTRSITTLMSIFDKYVRF